MSDFGRGETGGMATAGKRKPFLPPGSPGLSHPVVKRQPDAEGGHVGLLLQFVKFVKFVSKKVMRFLNYYDSFLANLLQRIVWGDGRAVGLAGGWSS